MSEILVNTIKKADGTGSITVPAETGTVLTSGTALSSFPSSFANGITMADQWRLTSDLTGDANPITANLERVDDDGFGGIGTGMSESSGIFTFPETGVYLIKFTVVQYVVSTGDYVRGMIRTTTNNSTYGEAAVAYTSAASTGTAFNSGSTDFVFDVTDTSTHKVAFRILQANTGNKVRGNTGENTTHMTFIRLGDT